MTSEMNLRINTLIMRGLSATEAAAQARAECPVCWHPKDRHYQAGCRHCQCGLGLAPLPDPVYGAESVFRLADAASRTLGGE